MMRRTHASRLFSFPIIQLPDINEQTVEVEFSEAEWLIYEAIEHYFIDSINGWQPMYLEPACVGIYTEQGMHSAWGRIPLQGAAMQAMPYPVFTVTNVL
jgi:hypothetical protein